METKIDKVDWYAYAQQYDMLLAYNPFYQELHQKVLEEVKKWKAEGGSIADVGAGSGNYSVEVARIHSRAAILHIENNEGMNTLAAKKAIGLSNFEVVALPVEQAGLGANSLNGLLCINALYTFSRPQEILEKMYEWLAPGAKAVIVDPGRVMNVFSWKIAISWHLLRNYGLKKTAQIFRQARAVSEQNTYIRQMQKSGVYWTHSHEEFCDAVRSAGFNIEHSELCFRGDCDLAVVRKPRGDQLRPDF